MNETTISDQTTPHQFNQAIISERAREAPRGHLGLSELGNPDSRTVWLNFRWSLPEEFSPRVLRIFRLGDLIESEVIRVLNSMPGVRLSTRNPDTGDQWRVSLFGGHVGGSMDGRLFGVPEAPKTEHVFECKSAKNSEFNQAKKNGIKLWKPTYFGQVQGYMGSFGLKRALYCVYNKDTSEIYWERIEFDPAEWERLQHAAMRLLERDEPPPSSLHPNHYEIKNFRTQQWQDVYWGRKVATPNCRNCVHAEVGREGEAEWLCNRHGHILTLGEQLAGCQQHLYIPALLDKAATLIETLIDQGIVRYKTLDGHEFWNCENTEPYPGAMVFDSLEICALTHNDGLNTHYLSDPGITWIREHFSGQYRPDGYVKPRSAV